MSRKPNRRKYGLTVIYDDYIAYMKLYNKKPTKIDIEEIRKEISEIPELGLMYKIDDCIIRHSLNKEIKFYLDVLKMENE